MSNIREYSRMQEPEVWEDPRDKELDRVLTIRGSCIGASRVIAVSQSDLDRVVDRYVSPFPDIPMDNNGYVKGNRVPRCLAPEMPKIDVNMKKLCKSITLNWAEIGAIEERLASNQRILAELKKEEVDLRDALPTFDKLIRTYNETSFGKELDKQKDKKVRDLRCKRKRVSEHITNLQAKITRCESRIQADTATLEEQRRLRMGNPEDDASGSR